MRSSVSVEFGAKGVLSCEVRRCGLSDEWHVLCAVWEHWFILYLGITPFRCVPKMKICIQVAHPELDDVGRVVSSNFHWFT